MNKFVRTVFPTVNLCFLELSRSVIYNHAKSVKGSVGISTAGTSMSKLKSKKNIILRHTINQYVKSFMIMRENISLYLP
jgi:hypothetical protein